MVKPEIEPKRVLLLASAVFESEVRAAFERQHQSNDLPLFFDLVYLDLTSNMDFFAVLDLLAYVTQGFLDVIHMIPPATTWSRSRHSGLPGQPPLQTRTAPLGLSSLSPFEDEKVRSANLFLEILAWCAEQALQCANEAVGLNLIFPEDLGGSPEGPAGADYKRPLGFFTTSLHLRSRLSLGWPHLENHHGNLRYKGNLPISCYCGRNHSPLIGITDTDEFQTSTSVALGPKFWDLCVFDHSLETRFNSLGDGGQSDLAPLAAVGIDPLLSVSLASGIGSLRPAYKAWKAGALTQSMLADIPGCDGCNRYFSEAASLHFSLSSSPRSKLCSL